MLNNEMLKDLMFFVSGGGRYLYVCNDNRVFKCNAVMNLQ